MVRHPRDWAWSSYRAHTGQRASTDWLESRALHRRLAPHAPLRDGPRKYAEFVAQGKGVPLWDEALQGQIYLGTEAFVKRMQAHIAAVPDREIPRVQRQRGARPLAYYLQRADRDQGILLAYREGGHTQTAIAQATALSVSRVSRLIAAMEAKGKT